MTDYIRIERFHVIDFNGFIFCTLIFKREKSCLFIIFRRYFHICLQNVSRRRFVVMACLLYSQKELIRRI